MNLSLLNAECCRAWFPLCCLMLVAPLAFAEEANIPPTVTGYLEELNDGTPSYSRYTGVMRYGLYSSPPAVGIDHAFLKFSLDSLPDSCVITSASIACYQFEHTGGLPVVDIRLVRDPVAQPPHDAFFGIENGTVVAAAQSSPDGLSTWQLDNSANPLLDSCRHVGVASFGIHWSGPAADTFRGAAYGFDSASAPVLHIVYAPSGVGESPRAPAVVTSFSLAPNPARGVLTVATRAAHGANLALRNTLGEKVKSYSLDPSGRIRLDLRGLAPGVYMATIEAGTQSLTRKLVITGR
jgi:hypothetical protein